eukprot:m.212097 g.212097  ORF g.212097 m.212097 type:complete len:93 (-) comp19537_c0_seq1:1295-1573(-)
MDEFKNKTVLVVTQDGRVIVGKMLAYDHMANVVLQECVERVFSMQAGVEQVALGLYLVRGDNVVLVANVDDDVDSALDFDSLRANPLNPVVY